MKIIILSILVAVALSVVAALVLSSEQRLAYQAYSTQSTRISDPGENLVGRTWSGDPHVRNG